MDRGEPPDGEVEVVRLPPEAVREPLPVVVRDREGDEQLGGGDPQPCPDRPVGRGERHEQLGEGEGQERVGRDRRGRGSPMSEPTRRPPKRWTSSTEKRGQRRLCALPPSASPSADDEAEDDVCRDARGAGRVPDRWVRGHVHAGTACVAPAQAPFSTISPSRPTKRPGIATLVEPRRARGRRAGSRPSRRRRRRDSSRRTP